jgi:5-methylcytosine-specific restriction endonuclease McrA
VPSRVCAFHGCHVLVERGYCAQHQRPRLETRHPTDPRYGLQAWRRYTEQRKAEHPFCVRCGALAAGKENGRARGVTDHIIPVSERPDLFDDPTNHRTLCTRCNATVRAERATVATASALTPGGGVPPSPAAGHRASTWWSVS